MKVVEHNFSYACMHIKNVKNGAHMRKLWILEDLGSFSEESRKDKADFGELTVMCRVLPGSELGSVGVRRVSR